MKKRISFRVTFAIVSMIICTLYLNLGMFIGILVFPGQLIKDISQYEEKYEKLRELLPTYSVVSYVSDDQKDENAARYYIAQYALAPTVLTRSLNQKMIIGNFSSASAKSEMCKKFSLVTIKDFGGGVIIFNRDIK